MPPRRFLSICCLLSAFLHAPALNRAAGLDDFNLPPAFRRKVEDRKTIDHHLETAYRTDSPVVAAPVQKRQQRPTERNGVIAFHETKLPPDDLAKRAAVPEKIVPLRGYRAPVLPGAMPTWSAVLPADLPEADRRGAALISERIAFDGLLPTLSKVMELLGPANLAENDRTLARLARMGFPVDLVSFFQVDGAEPRDFIRQRLSQGARSASLSSALSHAVFQFRPTQSGFEAIAENGELPLRWLRLQLRGGYENGGFIRGGSLDVAENLVKALPDAHVVASIEEPFAQFARLHAAASWDLRRRNQLTLIAEPLPVSPWARDNGAAGVIRHGSASETTILTPRYASMGEGESLLMPGESFLMTGLAQTGLKIIQSPLLFQGGNVLVAHEPSGQRALLLSESEVARNTALGLSINEVLRAFQSEFGVDRIVVMPTCSYHLDYDVTLKTVNDQMLAFVNDPIAAARIVVQLGIDSLARNHMVTEAQAAEALRELALEECDQLAEAIFEKLNSFRNAKGEFSERLSNCFGGSTVDAPGANLRTFCTSLDLLSGGRKTVEISSAFARMQAALRNQRTILEQQGWKVVLVPSMPDLRWGANYINGVHGTRRYLMPAYGGFYAKLDQAAQYAIQAALGDSVQIIPIVCAEMQRHYGGIHCMVSVLPAFSPAL